MSQSEAHTHFVYIVGVWLFYKCVVYTMLKSFWISAANVPLISSAKIPELLEESSRPVSWWCGSVDWVGRDPGTIWCAGIVCCCFRVIMPWSPNKGYCISTHWQQDYIIEVFFKFIVWIQEKTCCFHQYFHHRRHSQLMAQPLGSWKRRYRRMSPLRSWTMWVPCTSALAIWRKQK